MADTPLTIIPEPGAAPAPPAPLPIVPAPGGGASPPPPGSIVPPATVPTPASAPQPIVPQNVPAPPAGTPVVLHTAQVLSQAQKSQARTNIGVHQRDNAGTGIAPLDIPTHDGIKSTTHVSVAYIPGGWNGYAYWMAHTPYPSGSRELPNIACSHDGETWVEPAAISNPIFTASDVTAFGGTFSADTDIVLLPNNQLAVFFSCIDGGTGNINIIRSVSSDGINWTHADVGGTGHGDPNDSWTSVSVMVEDDGTTLRMFANGGATGMVTRTSADNGLTWGHGTQVNIPDHLNKVSWHSQVRKVNGTYHILWMNKFDTAPVSAQAKLYYFKSIGNDPLNFEGDFSEPFLPASIGDWDDHWNYRSCFVPRPGNLYADGLTWDLWIVGIPSGGSANAGSELTHPWTVRLFRNVVMDRDERPLSRREMMALLDRFQALNMDKDTWKAPTIVGSAGLGVTRQHLRLFTGSTANSSVYVNPATEGNFTAWPFMDRDAYAQNMFWNDRFRVSFAAHCWSFNHADVLLEFAFGSAPGSTDILATHPGARLEISKDNTTVKTHDGTSETVYANVTTGIASGRYREFALEFDAHGNVILYVDGNYVGKYSGTPVNTNTGFNRIPAYKLSNGAGAYSAITMIGRTNIVRITS